MGLEYSSLKRTSARMITQNGTLIGPEFSFSPLLRQIKHPIIHRRLLYSPWVVLQICLMEWDFLQWFFKTSHWRARNFLIFSSKRIKHLMIYHCILYSRPLTGFIAGLSDDRVNKIEEPTNGCWVASRGGTNITRANMTRARVLREQGRKGGEENNQVSGKESLGLVGHGPFCF